MKERVEKKFSVRIAHKISDSNAMPGPAPIDQPEVIQKILEHLGLWEEAHAPPDSEPPKTEITFDPSYSH